MLAYLAEVIHCTSPFPTPVKMGYEKEYDIEQHSPSDRYSAGKDLPTFYTDATTGVPGKSFEIGNSLYARLQRSVGKYGVEQRGIERVPEDERTDTSLAKVGTMVSPISPCENSRIVR